MLKHCNIQFPATIPSPCLKLLDIVTAARCLSNFVIEMLLCNNLNLGRGLIFLSGGGGCGGNFVPLNRLGNRQ